MDFNIFCNLDDIVKRYTQSYIFENNTENLCLQLIADVTEDDKEWILSEFDCKLPYGINFSHTYENGRLTVLFKEMI